MGNEMDDDSSAKIFFILLWISVVCHFYTWFGKDYRKARAVEEYLSHPEYYQIQYKYNKGDTIPVDTIVNYLK